MYDCHQSQLLRMELILTRVPNQNNWAKKIEEKINDKSFFNEGAKSSLGFGQRYFGGMSKNIGRGKRKIFETGFSLDRFPRFKKIVRIDEVTPERKRSSSKK
jgi:hypothetical protein